MLYSLIIIVGMQSFVVDSQLTMDDCKLAVETGLDNSRSIKSEWTSQDFYANGIMTAVCVKED